MKKTVIMLLSLFVLIWLIFYFNIQICPYYVIQRDYDHNKENFREVAQYMMDCDYPIIYVSEDNIINDNNEQTINSLVSKELLKTTYVSNLINAGYNKFEKDNGGVYFYKYFNWSGMKGVMYYPKGFSYDNNLVSRFVALDKNWYYFEEN